VTGGWGKQHNEELRDLYSSPMKVIGYLNSKRREHCEDAVYINKERKK
jgi:hypothetical protein